MYIDITNDKFLEVRDRLKEANIEFKASTASLPNEKANYLQLTFPSLTDREIVILKELFQDLGEQRSSFANSSRPNDPIQSEETAELINDAVDYTAPELM